MASLSFQDSKSRRGWRIQFRDKTKRKRSIWLGNIASHRAQEIFAHADHLIAISKEGLPPAPVTTAWLSSLDGDLREKLARAGLCESSEQQVARDITLADWLDMYIAERQDVADGTRQSYLKARDNLVNYFGAHTKLRQITKADAKRWRIWLAAEGNRRDKNRSTLAEATVRRRTGRAKQFFHEAVERGFCDSNPFDGLPCTVGSNQANQAFVPASSIEACMDHCPSTEWRTILALCRYGGFRAPSELAVLRWQNINLPEGRMLIDSPKTGLRVCPIFEELRPFLEVAWDEAVDGSEFVCPSVRPKSNLRTSFTRIIKAAGLVSWKRLFHNLRASRETELMARFPAKDVASWLGHSVPVAMKHYAMATEESFREAAGLVGGSTGGSILGTSQVISNNEPSFQKIENTRQYSVVMSADDSGEKVGVTPTGLEPVLPP